MFEKWRIKEHMTVVDASGQHVGTVDEIDGDDIKLTRNDSADGQHHRIPVKCVDSIDDDVVTLTADAPLPQGVGAAQAPAADPLFASDGDAIRSGTGGDDIAAAGGSSGIHATNPDPRGTKIANEPLFGTSGTGTGMGGSGGAQN